MRELGAWIIDKRAESGSHAAQQRDRARKARNSEAYCAAHTRSAEYAALFRPTGLFTITFQPDAQ